MMPTTHTPPCKYEGALKPTRRILWDRLLEAEGELRERLNVSIATGDPDALRSQIAGINDSINKYEDISSELENLLIQLHKYDELSNVSSWCSDYLRRVNKFSARCVAELQNIGEVADNHTETGSWVQTEFPEPNDEPMTPASLEKGVGTVRSVPVDASTSTDDVLRVSGEPRRSSSADHFCSWHGYHGHGLSHCKQFRILLTSQKLHHLSLNSLCYLCGFSHCPSRCRSNITCFVCSGRHLTVLHDVVTSIPTHNVVTSGPLHDVMTSPPMNNEMTPIPMPNVLTPVPMHNAMTSPPMHNVMVPFPLHNVMPFVPLHNVMPLVPVHDVGTSVPAHDVATSVPQHDAATSVPKHDEEACSIPPATKDQATQTYCDSSTQTGESMAIVDDVAIPSSCISPSPVPEDPAIATCKVQRRKKSKCRSSNTSSSRVPGARLCRLKCFALLLTIIGLPVTILLVQYPQFEAPTVPRESPVAHQVNETAVALGCTVPKKPPRMESTVCSLGSIVHGEGRLSPASGAYVALRH